MPAFAIYLRLGWVSSRNGLLFCTDDASHRVSAIANMESAV
jgi:hypothetical protein